jgi:hypothetical protein
MNNKYTADENNIELLNIGISKAKLKSKKKNKNKDIKTEDIIKCIINDKESLDQININGDFLKNGRIVREAMIVFFRIFIPKNYPEGVIDIEFPHGEDNSYGFSDGLEAEIKKDPYSVFRLFPRKQNKDISKSFYPRIETNLLMPISNGSIIPFKDHVFGKGVIYEMADMKSKTWQFSLEEIEIISPLKYKKLTGKLLSKSPPDYYEKVDPIKFDGPDYKAIIEKGESEKFEFKSSARWDYKQNIINKELEKTIVKTIAGFLNESGGTLIIGVDDDGNVLGLERDIKTLKKKNHDGYKLFLCNLISGKIGKEFNSYINIKFKKIDGNDICIIDLNASEKAAYVKDGNDYKFFIRTQNSTQELNLKKSHEYISSHWKKD